jgi:rRNA maturation endonuclease Nob1
MTRENIICDDCGADFTIEYESVEEIQYCPFCGADLFITIDDEEEEDDEYEDFDLEEEEQEE